MPDGPILGTTFIELATLDGKLKTGLSGGEKFVQESAKKMEKTFASSGSSISKNIASTYRSFGEAAREFNEKLAKGRSPVAQLQQQINLQRQLSEEMKKGGAPAAAQYGARLKLVNDMIARNIVRARQAKIELKDLRESTSEAGLLFNGFGGAGQNVANQLGVGGQFAKGAIAIAAVVESYKLFRALGDAIGVDQTATQDLFRSIATDVKHANNAVVDLGASLINLGKDAASYWDVSDVRVQHLRQDMAGLLNFNDKVAYGFKAATGLALARAMGIDLSKQRGFTVNPFNTSEQGRRVAEAYERAQAAGIAGQQVWHREVEKTSHTWEQLLVNVEKVAPALQRLADAQRQIGLDAAERAIAAQTHDWSAAYRALVDERNRALDSLQSQNVDPRVIAITRAQYDQGIKQLQVQQVSVQIAAKERDIAIAHGRAQYLVERSLTEQLNVLKARKTLIESVPSERDANRQAQAAENKLAIRQLNDEARARAMAVLQTQIEIAQYKKLYGEVDRLTKALRVLQREETARTNPGLAAILPGKEKMDDNITAAARLDSTIGIKQMQMETALLDGDIDRWRDLRDVINDATVTKVQYLNGGKGVISDASTAQAAFFGATLRAEARDRELDTRRTLLSGNQAILDIYKSRGQDVLAQLRQQARNEYSLQLDALERDKNFTTKSEEDKAAIRLQIASAMNLKIQQLDFELDQRWQARLDRQIKSLGTASQRMEQAWENTTQAMTQTSNDLFFDAFRTKFHDLDDVLKNFRDSILRTFSQILSDRLTKRLLELILSLGTKYFGRSQTGANDLLGGNTGYAASGAVWRGGFTPIRAFARGAKVISSPTVGLVGEGRYNEAVVPLPDGSRIPVQMLGGEKGHSEHVRVEVSLDHGLVGTIIKASSQAGYQNVADDIRNGGPLYHSMVHIAKRA